MLYFEYNAHTTHPAYLWAATAVWHGLHLVVDKSGYQNWRGRSWKWCSAHVPFKCLFHWSYL